MPRACHVLRVFTVDDDGGNHLGVINDQVGLDDPAMQAIATQLGFSETTFVDWQPGSPPQVRIFTPAMELPFAGHPLVGTAYVINEMGPGGVHTLRCGVGDVVTRTDGDHTWIDVPASGRVTKGDPELAAAAGLAEPVDAATVLLPKDYAVFEMASDADVTDAAPRLDVLSGRFGTYCYHREGDTVHARFFAPSAGVPEDPATGSAAVALAMSLRHRGELAGSLTILQGAEMGQPSRIALAWSGETISIGGSVRHDETRFLDD